MRRLLPLLREIAPSVHPRRGELLLAAASTLERGDAKGLRSLFAVADGERAPTKLRRNEDYDDGYDAGRRAQREANRAAAKQLLTAAASLEDPRIAKLARALAFSFCERGRATFHMLRFVCGLPSCLPERFAPADLAEHQGPVLGPLVESSEELARYLVELMKGDALEAEHLASAVWHATRRVALLPGLPRDEMESRLDRWLHASALESDPKKGALRMLRALGLSSAAARSLVALAPSEERHAGGLPEVVARGAASLDAGEDDADDEDDDVTRTPLPAPPGRFTDPWIRSIARLTPKDAHRKLTERWAHVPAWLEKVRRPLLRGTVVGIAEGAAGTFLEVRLHGGDETRYVAPPARPAAVRKRLRSLGLGDEHLFELVVAFDALRECAPDSAGGFLSFEDFIVVERARKRDDSVVSVSMLESDELKGWRDAVIVYEDATGDVLLLSPRGPIAWVRHGEGVIEVCGKSFTDFFARDGYVKSYGR
jgi:hypothetical protein